MVTGTHAALWVALLVTLASSSGAFAVENPTAGHDDEVIVIDEEPAAFFERAPSQLAKRMHTAIARACEQLPSTTLHCSKLGLVYFREVAELGRQTQSGYVCVGEDMYLRNKYFSPVSIYTNPTCVAVGCEERKSSCYLSVESLIDARRR
jgi:hypothetical protein